MRHRRRRRYRARRASHHGCPVCGAHASRTYLAEPVGANGVRGCRRCTEEWATGRIVVWDDVSPEQRSYNTLCNVAHIQMRECK